MKKIMIALAAVALAMGVQAAAVSWKVTNANYKGATVYAITGYTSAQVVSYFSSTTEADWSTAVSGATSGILNAARGVCQADSDSVGSSVVFAIVNPSIADGNAWLVTGDISTSGYTYSGTQTKPGTLSITAADFANSGTFTAVPEPTSGLLMLLGLAGLALKRKFA